MTPDGETQLFTKLGQIDGKLDAIKDDVANIKLDIKENEKDINTLKNWRWYITGMIAASHLGIEVVKKLLRGGE